MGESYFAAHGQDVAAGTYRFLANDEVIVAGDSLTDGNYGGGGYIWGLALARSPVIVAFNAGKAGDTIQQLWTRWPTDVTAKTPKAVLTRIGTNNVDASSTTDITSFVAAYQPIIDWHVSNGKRGLIYALPPEGTVLTEAAGIKARNDWLAAQCAAHPSLLAYVQDSTGIGDSEYRAVAAYYVNEVPAVHMNSLGRRTQGEAMAAALVAAFGQAESRLLDATDTYSQNSGSTQYAVNPHNAGTAGTTNNATYCTGTIPSNWLVHLYYGLTTTVCSKPAADGGDACQAPWFRVNFPSSAAANAQVTLFHDLQHPAFTDQIADLEALNVCIEARFVNFDASKWDSLELSVEGAGYAEPFYKTIYGLGFAKTLNETVLLKHGLPRNQYTWMTIAAVAANTLKLRLRLVSAAGFSGGAGSIDFRCQSARKRV